MLAAALVRILSQIKTTQYCKVSERHWGGTGPWCFMGAFILGTQGHEQALTSRMGAAVSWMDRIWVMLCCASSSLSRASVENHEISKSHSIQSQINPWKTQPKFSFFYPTTTNPNPHSNVSQANVALWLKSVGLVLNWKKNRKTNVSKTVQHLGPKARNSNSSNQISFYKRKPNVFYLGQMCLEHFFFLTLCKSSGYWWHLYSTHTVYTCRWCLKWGKKKDSVTVSDTLGGTWVASSGLVLCRLKYWII